MANRLERLTALMSVQKRVKDAHEMRHATYLAQAAAAEREIAAIIDRPDDDTSLSALFPDVYARHVERRRAEADKAREAAEAEARLIATETVRGKAIARAHRDASNEADRLVEETEMLETVERMLARK